MPTLIKPAAVMLCALALQLTSTAAQAQNQALVLDATPIYRQVPVAHKECIDVPTQERCTTITTYEDQVVGYDVLYEYEGQQHSKRMAYDPGTHIPVEQPARSGSYNSSGRQNSNVIVPGQKTYSSTIPGAPVVESIQHSSPQSDIPINIDLHLDRHRGPNHHITPTHPAGKGSAP